MELELEDPTYRPSDTPTIVERIAARLIHDPRDLPFLRLMAVLTATIVPTGVAVFLPGRFRWWIAGLHVALLLYFLGPFVLMLHNTSHRRLFRPRWSWMNYYIPWVLGPFFGETPEVYFTHHVGMHHPENNLDEDISSTLPYRRDSALDFARYLSRFFLSGLFELTRYFARKGRRSLLVRTIVGELSFYVAVVALLLVDWRATLIVFVLPLVVTRFAMMAGNWGQHAFVDEASPENNYRNSITCINSSYNRRCYNDGYHIGHHLKATRHWTEMPDELRQNVGTYAAEGAIVFRGIDFFGVWACLMLRRYDALVGRFVELGPHRRSPGEIEALLRSRTGWTLPPSPPRKRGGTRKSSWFQDKAGLVVVELSSDLRARLR